MNKVQNYVNSIKEYLECKKIIDLSISIDDDISFFDILAELDSQGIKYKTVNYINDNGQTNILPHNSLYCEQFYIESEDRKR